MRVESHGVTDVGLKRSHNEDHFACDDELGLYLVADGMGGHAAGEVASHSAIKAIQEFIGRFCTEDDLTWPFDLDPDLNRTENALRISIRLANGQVCQQANEKEEYNGMGTTVVGLIVYGKKATVAHVGDSRLYRLRNASLELLTLDHSWVNEQLRNNIITEEEAKNHRWRNVITRALGNKADLEVEMNAFDVESGDIYLICSDGLSGMIPDKDLRRIMLEHIDSLPEACDALIARANANGGMDNITAVAVRATDC